MILRADARNIPLRDGCVQTVVTSPPYFGLRDYGVAGQIGLERTLDDYIRSMRDVFAELWRVCRDDATVWLNIGDSYAGSCKGQGGVLNSPKQRSNPGSYFGAPTKLDYEIAGLKPKDLMGVPWRVAFALQADGWYLRSDIIWAKPNPMPESMTDRPTRSHEYIFLLSKRERYFYDADAIREPYEQSSIDRLDYPFTGGNKGGQNGSGRNWAVGQFDGGKRKVEFTHSGRNKRSVWTVNSEPSSSGVAAYDTGRIASPDCPVHGHPAYRLRAPQYGEQSTVSESRRNPGIGSDRELGPLFAASASNEGRLGQGEGEFSASDRSNGTHKTADSSAPDETSADKSASGIEYKEPARRSAAKSARKRENKSAVDYGEGARVLDPSAETLAHSVDSSCTCQYTGMVAKSIEHFAQFPQKLIEPCILAGTSEKGCCAECGAPRVRMIERVEGEPESYHGSTFTKGKTGINGNGRVGESPRGSSQTTGWRPSCSHDAPSVPCIVLDPFLGSGTVGKVAERFGRRWVGLELSAAYIQIAEKRTAQMGMQFGSRA